MATFRSRVEGHASCIGEIGSSGARGRIALPGLEVARLARDYRWSATEIECVVKGELHDTQWIREGCLQAANRITRVRASAAERKIDLVRAYEHERWRAGRKVGAGEPQVVGGNLCRTRNENISSCPCRIQLRKAVGLTLRVVRI